MAPDPRSAARLWHPAAGLAVGLLWLVAPACASDTNAPIIRSEASMTAKEGSPGSLTTPVLLTDAEASPPGGATKSDLLIEDAERANDNWWQRATGYKPPNHAGGKMASDSQPPPTAVGMPPPGRHGGGKMASDSQPPPTAVGMPPPGRHGGGKMFNGPKIGRAMKMAKPSDKSGNGAATTAASDFQAGDDHFSVCAKDGKMCKCQQGVVMYGSSHSIDNHWADLRVDTEVNCSADNFTMPLELLPRSKKECRCYSLDWCRVKAQEMGLPEPSMDPVHRRRTQTSKKGVHLHQRRRWCGFGALDCEWDEWSDWGKCSNCGMNGGQRARMRNKVVTERGGGTCSGKKSESQSCTC